MLFKLLSSAVVNESEDGNPTLNFSGTIVASSGQSAKLKALLPQGLRGMVSSAQAPHALFLIAFFGGGGGK